MFVLATVVHIHLSVEGTSSSLSFSTQQSIQRKHKSGFLPSACYVIRGCPVSQRLRLHQSSIFFLLHLQRLADAIKSIAAHTIISRFAKRTFWCFISPFQSCQTESFRQFTAYSWGLNVSVYLQVLPAEAHWIISATRRVPAVLV